jgi:outer membrane protein TolC
MKAISKRAAGIAMALAIAIAGAVAPASALAQDAASEKKTVTVDEAVELAMENNIQLKSSAIDLRVKQRDAAYAWNSFLPSVQATGTLARTNMDEVTVNMYPVYQTGPGTAMAVPTPMTVDLDEKDRWTAMGGLTVSLNLNLALFEGLKATRQNYESGKLTYAQARQETEINVRKAFYGILMQDQSIALSRDKLANSEERVKQTQTNYKNGLVSELTLLQTQLACETQKPALREAENGFRQQKAMFAFLLGLPVGTEIDLSGSIAPDIAKLDANALIAKHLGSSYDVAILRASREMLDTQLRAARLQRYTPSVALSQGWQPSLTSKIDSNWLDGDNWQDSSGAFSLTLAFNLTNLLPFSQNGMQIQETKDNAEKLDNAIRMTLYNEELEIRNLVEKLDKSKASIATMEMSVSLAQKAYGLTEQGYRAGAIEYLDLKDAENALLSAKLGVLAEKFTYISTALDLEKALNAKLD